MARRPRSHLLNNLISVMAGEAAARAAGLVALVVVARYLGPYQLGALALAQSLLMLASAAADGGLTISGTNALTRQPESATGIVRNIALAQSVLAGTFGLLLFLISLTLVDSTGVLVVLLVPFLVVQAMNLQYVLQAQERFASAAVARAVGQAVTALASTVGAIVTHDPAVVAVAFWVGPLVTDVLIMRQLRELPFRALRTPGHQVVGTLRGGLPFMSTSMAGQYVLSLGPITVGIVLNTRAVGEYSAASRTVLLLYILITLVVSAIYPEMVRRHRDNNQLPRFMQEVSTVAVRGAFALAVLLFFAAGPVVSLLFGSEFKGSIPIMQVLVLSLPIAYHNALASRSLMAVGLETLVAKCVAKSAIFATIAYPVATILMGSRGTALAYTLVLAVQALLLMPGLRSAKFATLPPVRTLYFFAAPAAVLLATRALPWTEHLATDLALWALTLIVLELLTDRSSLRLARRLLGHT